MLYTYKPIVKYSCEIYPIYIYMYMYMFYNKKYGKIRFTDWYFFSMTIWRFICCNKYYIKINNRFTVKKGRNLTEPEDEFTDDDNIIQSLDVVDQGWVLFLDKQIVYIMFIIYHLSPVKYLFGPILPRHHSACSKEIDMITQLKGNIKAYELPFDCILCTVQD